MLRRGTYSPEFHMKDLHYILLPLDRSTLIYLRANISMTFLSITGVVLITSALILYSLGVWGEKYKRTILSIHIISFWLGLTADFTGTMIMASLAERIELNLHGITGMIAILLMAVHATWATIVYRGDDEQKKQQFHKYSIVVWLFWLIPYFSGMYLAMSH